MTSRAPARSSMTTFSVISKMSRSEGRPAASRAAAAWDDSPVRCPCGAPQERSAPVRPDALDAGFDDVRHETNP